LNLILGRELAVEGNVDAHPQHHFLEILRTVDVKCSYLGYWLSKLLHSCSVSFNTEDNYPLFVEEEGGLAESQSCWQIILLSFPRSSFKLFSS